jgi:N4-gp56 family major capsid protein
MQGKGNVFLKIDYRRSIMPITSYLDLSPELQASYDRAFLIKAKPLLTYYEHAQKRSMPANEGEVRKFIRMKPLPKRIEPLTESLDLGIPIANYKTFSSHEISVIPKRYGDVAATSYKAEKIAFSKALAERAGIMGQQAAESIEELVKLKVGAGLLRRRADGDPAYQKDSITTAVGTLNTLVDSALTEADDYWNGAFVTFTDQSDSNYGITAQVVDFSAGVITFDRNLDYAVKQGAKYRITSSTDTASADILTFDNLLLALRDLKDMKARPFSDGNYVCIIDPFIEADFKRSADWKNMATYRQDAKNIYNGEIGKWLNIRFVVASEVYRETVAGVYDPAGDVHVATLLGSDAYGAIELAGGGKKIFFMDARQLAQPLPSYSTIAWQIYFETLILNATFGINIPCGVSK